MRGRTLSWRGPALVGLIVGTLLSVGVPTHVVLGESIAKKRRQADVLVKEALHREIYGQTGERNRLLAEARRLDPKNEAARWHSGQVKFKGEWVKVEDVPKLRAEDARFSDYERRRMAATDTVADQLELATWCRKRKLADQERAHLTRVIELEPNHSEARTRLGFRRIDGRWVSAAEILAARERSVQMRKDFARWQPKLIELRRTLLRSEGSRLQFTQNQVRSINDPSAIPALELVLGTANEMCAGLVVDTLSGISDPEAAVSLARLGVFSQWAPVREKAVVALRSKDKQSYIPLLLSSMFTPVEARAAIFRTPRGRLVHRNVFVREGQTHREVVILDTEYRRENRGGDAAETTARALVGMAATGQARTAAAATQNEMTRRLNTRITEVLAESTGERQIPPTADAWWSWWNEHNEVFVQGEKTTVTRYRQDQVTVVDRVNAPTGGDEETGDESETADVQLSMPMDCLAAGTLVWSAKGRRPIEEIKVGDLVLSQDPETGELAYKPVLGTTIRPASRLVRIEAGSEQIETSGGHLFWVSGEGWVKAREVKSGADLHSAHGTMRISSVERGKFEPTYNLIVADFHTYFIGRGRILSHDNTIREPTAAVVPGLKQ